jgi:hypothetical protein
MLGALMELAPLPNVFIFLPIVLIFLQLRLVVLRLSIIALSFALWVGTAFSMLMLFGVRKPKLPRILFKLPLDFENISIGSAQGRDVHKIYLFLDVSM